MDIISAYREVGSYRGAAAICETTPKRDLEPGNPSCSATGAPSP